MHLEDQFYHVFACILDRFNPSFYMDASGSAQSRRLPQGYSFVSILVSIWMHLEACQAI